MQYGWVKNQVRRGAAVSSRCWGWRPGIPPPSVTTRAHPALQWGCGEHRAFHRILGHRQFWDKAGLAGLSAKALVEAMDVAFDLEGKPHWSLVGGRLGLALPQPPKHCLSVWFWFISVFTAHVCIRPVAPVWVQGLMVAGK